MDIEATNDTKNVRKFMNLYCIFKMYLFDVVFSILKVNFSFNYSIAQKASLVWFSYIYFWVPEQVRLKGNKSINYYMPN